MLCTSIYHKILIILVYTGMIQRSPVKYNLYQMNHASITIMDHTTIKFSIYL